MEKDTDRTLRNIHGNAEALAAQMADIEKFIVEDEPRSQEFLLRFVTVCKSQPKSGDDNAVHLHLTPFGELDSSAQYIAVSYTWEQPGGLAEALGINVPNYVLWTSETECCPLRCPALVLHRALNYALELSQEPLIWIDQECIDQDDPSDIERHLQLMHKVYRKSLYTVALLTQPVASAVEFEKIWTFITTTHWYKRLDSQPKDTPNIESIINDFISDSWFRRTWTFQERYCSRDLYYLLPVQESLYARMESEKGCLSVLPIPSGSKCSKTV
jgi:hypothetical protein